MTMGWGPGDSSAVGDIVLADHTFSPHVGHLIQPIAMCHTLNERGQISEQSYHVYDVYGANLGDVQYFNRSCQLNTDVIIRLNE